MVETSGGLVAVGRRDGIAPNARAPTIMDKEAETRLGSPLIIFREHHLRRRARFRSSSRRGGEEEKKKIFPTTCSSPPELNQFAAISMNLIQYLSPPPPNACDRCFQAYKRLLTSLRSWIPPAPHPPTPVSELTASLALYV